MIFLTSKKKGFFVTSENALILIFLFFVFFTVVFLVFDGGTLTFLQVTTDIGTVLKSCTNQTADTKQLEESMSQMNGMAEAARLSSLLHLTCLLFEVRSLPVYDNYMQLLNNYCD